MFSYLFTNVPMVMSMYWLWKVSVLGQCASRCIAVAVLLKQVLRREFLNAALDIWPLKERWVNNCITICITILFTYFTCLPLLRRSLYQKSSEKHSTRRTWIWEARGREFWGESRASVRPYCSWFFPEVCIHLGRYGWLIWLLCAGVLTLLV